MTDLPIPTWDDIARTHGRFMYSVAYRLVGNEADAQDLVQEALIRVHRGLANYQPGSMEGWLARIVTNVFLDDARRRKRRPVDALPEYADTVLPATPGADVCTDGFSDEVQRALAGLPEEFRVAVVLSDVAELPYEEIAVATNVPVGTVRSRIHRGRKLLRERLPAEVVE
ncbi:MAG: sigma-70 family RNA polymerase sigma factor [Acidimicrobiia bacterium]